MSHHHVHVVIVPLVDIKTKRVNHHVRIVLLVNIKIIINSDIVRIVQVDNTKTKMVERIVIIVVRENIAIVEGRIVHTVQMEDISHIQVEVHAMLVRMTTIKMVERVALVEQLMFTFILTKKEQAVRGVVSSHTTMLLVVEVQTR